METASISVSIHGQEWLQRAESEWTELLHDSDANKLFLSWTWTKMWWDCARPNVDAEALILAARSSEGRLVGVLPLYVEHTKLRGLIYLRRLQFIGNCWSRSDLALITEYLGPIVRHGWLDTVPKAFVVEVLSLDEWDEFCPQYVCSGSPFFAELAAAQSRGAFYVRAVEQMNVYGVDTTKSYSDYLFRLKGKMRRRLHNQRAQLGHLGGVEIDSADAETLGSHLRHFESLHKIRWNSVSSAGRRLFCERLCRYLLAKGQLRFSLMRVGGRAASSILNAVVDGVEYNLRLAIDDRGFPHISPGFLHLGYALEAAFAARDTMRFDLLAGAGKQSNYKATIATADRRLTTFQLIRRRAISYAYRAYDFIRPTATGHRKGEWEELERPSTMGPAATRL